MNIKQYEKELVADLQKLIQIASVKDETASKPRLPFGKAISEALAFVLDRGTAFGFRSVNVDGYAGRIEWGTGERDDIGILGHVDVVPAGEGWKYPPFEAHIDGDRIYGRGTVDDKGPTMAALYAMRALRESGVKPNKKVVLILGCDEECGWECMDYYESKYKMPVTGFTPDAEFPVINCEKGIFQAKYELPLPEGKIKIKSLIGGDRVNVVPDTAALEAKVGDSEIKTEASGVRSHGSTPELGANALWQIFKSLRELCEQNGEENSPIVNLHKLLSDTDGTGLGIKSFDEESGALTLNTGTAEYKDNKLIVGIDIRYPVTKTLAEIEKAVTTILTVKFGSGVKKIWGKNMLPHCVDKNSALVKTLLAAYETVTGQEGYAFAIGGGTYAKAMKNGVAFGPNFPGQENLVHKTNEFISIEHLLKLTDIYREAIGKLLEQQ